jgi:hypothetical protein
MSESIASRSEWAVEGRDPAATGSERADDVPADRESDWLVPEAEGARDRPLPDADEFTPPSDVSTTPDTVEADSDWTSVEVRAARRRASRRAAEWSAELEARARALGRRLGD